MTILSTIRNKTSAFSAGLDPDRLERLLCQTLLRHTKDAELVALISEFEGLGARCHSQGLERCQNDLNNAATMLAISLSSAFSRQLPAQLVLEVHSAIGLIREAQGQHASAIQSHLRAFWVASATTNIPQEELGRVLHRLGKAYGLSGKYQTGRSLLEKAIEIYEKEHLDKESCMEEAGEALKALDCVIVNFADSRVPEVLTRPKSKVKRRAAYLADEYSKRHALFPSDRSVVELPGH
jgi:tetratricopeptide (TPR) repeat protein